jgi:hypothetical protein
MQISWALIPLPTNIDQGRLQIVQATPINSSNSSRRCKSNNDSNVDEATISKNHNSSSSDSDIPVNNTTIASRQGMSL